MPDPDPQRRPTPTGDTLRPDHARSLPDRRHEMPGLTAPPPEEAWTEVADQLGLLTPYTSLWEAGEHSGRWMTGAEINLSVSCVERHLPERGDQVALHWEGEPGDRRSVTYAELHEQVVALARALRSMGVGVGDRVGLHLGWLPETVVAMLACARIGAVHTVLPAPLPAEPLADRLALLDLKVLFTQDGAWRHGTVLPLKARADEAMLAAGGIQHTVVVRRTGMDVQWFEGDRWLHDLLATTRPGQDDSGGWAVALPVDHPVASVPLANRGGQAVSIVHGSGTMLAGAVAVHRHLSTGGPFWCAGDIAWAVTQFHGIYGPLACGDTTVMYEGTLDVPNHQRAWDIIRRYDVEVLVTSPSVIRTVRGWAREMPEVSAIPTLRRVATAGEPVEEEVATWMRSAFGADGLEVADAWGQLELGGIVRVTGLADARPLPDVGLQIVDHDATPVGVGEEGEVVLTRPWAGTMVGVDGDAAGVSTSHWTRHPGVYATGDLASCDEAGHVEFLGRTDDVVSISGQLVSLREVREVLTDHPYVDRADVTWRKHSELGRALVAAVTLSDAVVRGGSEVDVARGGSRADVARGGSGADVARDDSGADVAREDSGADVAQDDSTLDAIAVELMDTVRELLGGLARPRALLVVDRFGDELGRRERARAIATLATPDRHGAPRSVRWEQVLAAAGHPVS